MSEIGKVKIRECDTPEWKARVEQEARRKLAGLGRASLPVHLEGQFNMSDEEMTKARVEAWEETWVH